MPFSFTTVCRCWRTGHQGWNFLAQFVLGAICGISILLHALFLRWTMHWLQVNPCHNGHHVPGLASTWDPVQSGLVGLLGVDLCLDKHGLEVQLTGENLLGYILSTSVQPFLRYLEILFLILTMLKSEVHLSSPSLSIIMFKSEREPNVS